jgi:hypothetical protein
MDKFSMAMGITLLNKVALFAMTLAQVVGESKYVHNLTFEQQWKRVEWDVSQKVESKEQNETKKRVWISYNPWRCKVGPGPNPLCS